MNRVAAEFDIRHGLRKFFATHITYPKMQGFAAGTIVDIEGDVDAVPYGDLYQVGDVFTDPVGDGQLGLIYYVVAVDGRNMRLQLESAQGNMRPKVVAVDKLGSPEIAEGDSRVHVGIRIRPTARSGFVNTLNVNRLLHQDGQHVVLATPFWRGGGSIYVEGTDKNETAYVFEMVNSRQKIISDIYKFELDFVPIRAEVVGLEAGGLFRNILIFNLTATVTPATPIHDLPDGMPTVYFPFDPILGVSPVIEDDRFPEPRDAEKVGNYPLTDDPDYWNVADMPPTE